MVDTIIVARQLKESGIPAEQAKGIEMDIEQLMESNLATKSNLKDTETELEIKLERLKNDLQKQLQEVKAELQNEIRTLYIKLEHTKTELKKDIHSLDLKIEQTNLKIEQTKAELQKDLRQLSSRTIMWVAGILIGKTTVVVTLLNLFA